MSRNPFHIAERYIQLRKTCVSSNWVDTLQRIQDMILMPWIALWMILSGSKSVITIASSFFKAYRSWSQWMEYNEMRFEVQRMMLVTAKNGGPFITTNDPAYLPYVFADAVIRTSMS